MLNCYYTLTDNYKVYRIAMVLHLRYKLQYFRKAGWPDEWIDAAKQLVLDEFERSYLNLEPQDNEDSEPEETSSKVERVTTKMTSPPVAKNIFADSNSSDDKGTARQCDEIQLYLSAPIEKPADALHWWISKCKLYPHLSQMALDYLTIPGTSVDVERLFSRGRLILSHTCSRLSTSSTCALLCLGSWSNMGFIRDEDLQQVGNLNEIDSKLELEKASDVLKGSE